MVVLPLEMGQQSGLELVGGSEARVSSLGGKRAVAVAVIYKEGLSQAGTRCNHRPGTTGDGLTGVERLEIGGGGGGGRGGGGPRIVYPGDPPPLEVGAGVG